MGSDVGSAGWQPITVPGGRAVLARTPKEEAFLRLALTHALVMGGDAMVTVAMAGSIFFTTDVNQARIKLVGALLLTMAPFAVVAPLLGPAIDRSKGGRRLMLVAAAAGRCLVCLYMATVVHSVLLYPCALVVLILSKAHAVAKSALVPATVDGPADFVKAGGRLAVLAAVASVVAGGPAAAVLKLSGAPWVLRLAAAVYAGGAVMAARTRPAPPATMEPADHVDETLRSRGVSLAATSMTTLRACSGFLTFAIAFVFRRTHAPTWWYGVVVLGAVVGGFMGNLVGPSLRRWFGEERILTLALCLVGSVGLVAARFNSRPGFALLALSAGVADGIGQLAFDAVVQRDGSEGARGRSFARFEATFQLAWVAAALLPVIIPVPNWVVCLMIAVATGVSAVYYTLGRRAAAAAARRNPDPGGQTGTAVEWTAPTPPYGTPPVDPGDPSGGPDRAPPDVGPAPAPPAPTPLPVRTYDSPVVPPDGGPRRNPGRLGRHTT